MYHIRASVLGGFVYRDEHAFNSLPLLGISTPKKVSSIIQFSQIHINLGVHIRKDTNSLSVQWKSVLCQ